MKYIPGDRQRKERRMRPAIAGRGQRGAALFGKAPKLTKYNQKGMLIAFISRGNAMATTNSARTRKIRWTIRIVLVWLVVEFCAKRINKSAPASVRR